MNGESSETPNTLTSAGSRRPVGTLPRSSCATRARTRDHAACDSPSRAVAVQSGRCHASRSRSAALARPSNALRPCFHDSTTSGRSTSERSKASATRCETRSRPAWSIAPRASCTMRSTGSSSRAGTAPWPRAAALSVAATRKRSPSMASRPRGAATPLPVLARSSRKARRKGVSTPPHAPSRRAISTRSHRPRPGPCTATTHDSSGPGAPAPRKQPARSSASASTLEARTTRSWRGVPGELLATRGSATRRV